MKIYLIRQLPTCIDSIPERSNGIHESVLRSYNILEKTKAYLKEGVPPKVVLELIDEMEA
ncbi:MAG TPA: hypothetical protein ACFYD4_08140 [Candidatus Wunengus sp. YC61]|uniref:hypothetical protein n=1 Tax=Candidatus Wunengus sp. YC61 TaxID=3367698 RepID=UPI0040291BCE